MWRLPKARGYGTKSWTQAMNSASKPAAWARVIRCAWKPRWRSTATKFTLPSRRWEADLGWIVKLDKGDFIGRAALVKQNEQGIRRKLVGFEMCGRGIGRDGYEVLAGRRASRVGHQRIARARPKQKHRSLLPAGGRSASGRGIEIVIRSQPVEAVTVETPFYKRAK